MRIKAQLFAILRERVGSESVVADLPEGATVADALAAFGRAHPRLGEALERMPVVMAVNHEYAPEDRVLEEGDEIALVPPVSGGAGPEGDGDRVDRADRLRVEVTGEPLSLDTAVEFVTVPEAGAVVTFQGVTREVEKLEYEAYEPMAEKRLRQICAEALAAHGVERVAALHRVGEVALGKPSVIVAASSAHRPEAFAAAREMIDRIKAEAPIWKREREGEEARWVEGTPPPVEGTPPPVEGP